MNFAKNFLFFFISFISLFGFFANGAGSVLVQGVGEGGILLVPLESNLVEVHFFYKHNCPFCASEEKFLDGIEIKYPEIKINRYYIGDSESQELLKALCEKCHKEQYLGLVPITFVGDEFFVGFNDSTGGEIEASIKKYIEGSVGGGGDDKASHDKIKIPFIGEVNISKYSFPAQAVLLGFFDGFNVCSLGSLVLILALLLNLGSRKKVLLFGGLFIITASVIYGFLILIWYQFFSILSSYLKTMEILIGLLGLGGGIYFFKQFIKFRKSGPICEVIQGDGLVSRFSLKIQETLKGSKGIIAGLVGVFLFAAVITIMEFPCSAVLPVLFAGSLANAGISAFQEFLYIAVYILFYMLDEVIVFLIALFTMKIKLASSKFVVWLSLIEAIVLSVFGLYYLAGIFGLSL